MSNKMTAERKKELQQDFDAWCKGDGEALFLSMSTTDVYVIFLEAELDKSIKETEQWKSNHGDMIKRNRELRERPDLGMRSKAVIALQDELVSLQEEHSELRSHSVQQDVTNSCLWSEKNILSDKIEKLTAVLNAVLETMNLHVEMAALSKKAIKQYKKLLSTKKP